MEDLMFPNVGTLRSGLDVDHGEEDSFIESQEVEDRLILAAREGDLSAFNRLVLAYQGRLYWWVYSLVRDEDLADDVTQATFIAAYQKLDTFRGGSFRGWLYKIARNRGLDEIRRKKRHPLISLDAPPEKEEQSDGDSYEMLSRIPNDAPHPEDAAIQSEQAQQIRRVLETLPEPFREVLVLVDLNGLDYLEVAALLNLPLGTVKSRLTRARLKFRELFIQNGAPEIP